MKSTLSIAYLLTFAINMVSSQIVDLKTGSFQCTSITAAQSCMGDIQKFANPNKNLKPILIGTEVFVSTIAENYNSCAEFTNEILGIGSCKQCPSIGIDRDHPEYCDDAQDSIDEYK